MIEEKWERRSWKVYPFCNTLEYQIIVYTRYMVFQVIFHYPRPYLIPIFRGYLEAEAKNTTRKTRNYRRKLKNWLFQQSKIQMHLEGLQNWALCHFDWTYCIRKNPLSTIIWCLHDWFSYLRFDYPRLFDAPRLFDTLEYLFKTQPFVYFSFQIIVCWLKSQLFAT